MGGNKFGPWMVVSRIGKTGNYAGKNFSHGTVEEQPNGQPSNSRFAVLASQDPGDNEHEYVATDTQGKETSHADPKQPHKNYVLQPHASEFKPMPLDTQPSPMMIPHHAPTTLNPLMHTSISVHNPNNKLIDTHELDGDTIQMSREIKGRSLPFLGDPPDLHGGDTNLEMEADPNYVEDEDDAKTTADVESFLHAIRDCVYSRGIWRKLVPAPRQHDFFSYPLRQWIMTNLRRRACDMGSLFWPVMFGIAT
ncbi:hypothetical protein WN943_019670 [Citrus x changshan-huyou]